MKYDGNQWILTTKEDLIDTIYEAKKSYIEANMDSHNLTESRKKALERWLDDDDNDNEKIKQIIKLLLYNSKDMAIATRDSQKVKNAKLKSKSIKAVKDVD